MKEQLMGTVVTRVPKVYTAGVGSSPMNLIHQRPSIPLDIFQQGAHANFGTALADGDTIPEQPWISVALDPSNNNADEDRFYTRRHANVVVEIVKNFLTPNGWDDLMLQQHNFAFTDITGMRSTMGQHVSKSCSRRLTQQHQSTWNSIVKPLRVPSSKNTKTMTLKCASH